MGFYIGFANNVHTLTGVGEEMAVSVGEVKMSFSLDEAKMNVSVDEVKALSAWMNYDCRQRGSLRQTDH